MMNFPTFEDYSNDFDTTNSVVLGIGSFGKVFKVRSKVSLNKKPPHDYAVKFIETLRFWRVG